MWEFVKLQLYDLFQPFLSSFREYFRPFLLKSPEEYWTTAVHVFILLLFFIFILWKHWRKCWNCHTVIVNLISSYSQCVQCCSSCCRGNHLCLCFKLQLDFWGEWGKVCVCENQRWLGMPGWPNAHLWVLGWQTESFKEKNSTYQLEDQDSTRILYSTELYTNFK